MYTSQLVENRQSKFFGKLVMQLSGLESRPERYLDVVKWSSRNGNETIHYSDVSNEFWNNQKAHAVHFSVHTVWGIDILVHMAA